MFARIKLADGRTARVAARSVEVIVDRLHGKPGCFICVSGGGDNDMESAMSADEVEDALWEARKSELELELSVREEFLRRTGR